jgi:hypothetical protein
MNTRHRRSEHDPILHPTVALLVWLERRLQRPLPRSMVVSSVENRPMVLSYPFLPLSFLSSCEDKVKAPQAIPLSLPLQVSVLPAMSPPCSPFIHHNLRLQPPPSQLTGPDHDLLNPVPPVLTLQIPLLAKVLDVVEGRRIQGGVLCKSYCLPL